MHSSSLPAPAVPASSPLAVFVAGARRRVDDGLVRVADRVHAAGDARALVEGWTVTRVGRTGRVYRSPLFDTLGGAR